MPTTAADAPIRYPVFRVLTADRWHNSSTAESAADYSQSGIWTVQPMWSKTARGFDIISMRRCCLPEMGDAVLRYRLGRIDGSVQGTVAGTTWTVGTSTLNVPDLAGKIVRIQHLVGTTLTTTTYDGSGGSTTETTDISNGSVQTESSNLYNNIKTTVTNQWKTVWLGFCEYQQDKGFPGSDIPAGDRLYYCWDLFALTTKWFPTAHLFATQTTPKRATIGYGAHPGYNVAIGNEGKVRGNRANNIEVTLNDIGTYIDNSGSGESEVSPRYAGDRYSRNPITWPSDNAATWEDDQVCNDLCAVNRPVFNPLFQFDDAGSGLLAGSAAWQVQTTESVFNIVCRVLSRSRGRGICHLWWADDTGSDIQQPLQIAMRVKPMVEADITASYPKFPPDGSTLTTTILGATNYPSIYDTSGVLDLIGDHRLVEDQFSVGSSDLYTYDYVETWGEPIRVLVTLSTYDGSLAPRWTNEEATAFWNQTSANNRIVSRWEHVYHSFWLNLNWDWTCYDGVRGAAAVGGVKQHRVDYSCNDDGTIKVPVLADPQTASPYSSRLRLDTPLLVGYNYANTTIVREDATSEQGQPQFREASVLINANRSTPGVRWTAAVLAPQISVSMGPQYITIGDPANLNDGLRVLGGVVKTTGPFRAGDVYQSGGSIYHQCVAPVTSALPPAGTLSNAEWIYLGSNGVGQFTNAVGGVVAHGDISLVCSIDLSNHVRYASGDRYGRRRKIVSVPNLHLWLASPGGVWRTYPLASPQSFQGQPGMQIDMNAAGATMPDDKGAHTPGILRDDRAALAQVHALAWAWYGQQRRPCRWALRDFGLAVNWRSSTGLNVPYPQIGEFIKQVRANGLLYTVNTPVTTVSYDHESGTTYWQSDFNDLDFGSISVLR